MHRGGLGALLVLAAASTAVAHQGHFHSVGVATPTLVETVVPDARTAFAWPYLLVVPPAARDRAERGENLHVLVVPNDTGQASDRFAEHEAAALGLAGATLGLADALATPLLVPVFPRPEAHAAVQVQALDRDCFGSEVEVLKRPDLQLVAMIEDARRRLEARGWVVDGKVVVHGGAPASGHFAQRFVALHPARVAAACAQVAGGWPLLPLEVLGETPLPYPLGVGELADLTGAAFDREAWAAVPLFLYLADQAPDPASADLGFDAVHLEAVAEISGATPEEHRMEAVARFAAEAPRVQFRAYEESGDELRRRVTGDLVEFLRRVATLQP